MSNIIYIFVPYCNQLCFFNFYLVSILKIVSFTIFGINNIHLKKSNMKKYLVALFFLVSFVALIAQEKSEDEKKLSFNLSGFVNLNAIIDFNGLDDYNDFTTSQIPINPSPYEKAYHLHATAEQTRLNLGINYKTPWGNLRGFVSGDFSSGVETYLHMREAYLEIGDFLFGQTNTTFGYADIVPVTIDFEGPNSSTTLRNPMIRYMHKLKKSITYSIALENRGTDWKPFVDKNGNTIDRSFKTMPALIVNVNKKGKLGVISMSGMVNNTKYFNADSNEFHEISYGGAFSVIINTSKQNHFNVFFIAGKGISNFINDLSGNGYNGVPDISTDRLVLLNSIGGFVSYTQFWSQKLSSNFIFSYIQLEKSELLDKEDFHHSSYALANLFYSPFNRLNFGVEYIWGELFIQDNQNGNANRLQFLAQFTF